MQFFNALHWIVYWEPDECVQIILKLSGYCTEWVQWLYYCKGLSAQWAPECMGPCPKLMAQTKSYLDIQNKYVSTEMINFFFKGLNFPNLFLYRLNF